MQLFILIISKKNKWDMKIPFISFVDMHIMLDIIGIAQIRVLRISMYPVTIESAGIIPI